MIKPLTDELAVPLVAAAADEIQPDHKPTCAICRDTGLRLRHPLNVYAAIPCEFCRAQSGLPSALARSIDRLMRKTSREITFKRNRRA